MALGNEANRMIALCRKLLSETRRLFSSTCASACNTHSHRDDSMCLRGAATLCCSPSKIIQCRRRYVSRMQYRYARSCETHRWIRLKLHSRNYRADFLVSLRLIRGDTDSTDRSIVPRSCLSLPLVSLLSGCF